MQPLTKVYFGNPLWAWMTAALAIAVAMSAGAFLRGFFRKRFEGAGATSRNILERIALRTSILLVFGISVWAAGLILSLPEKWEQVLRTVAILSIAVQVALWLHAVISCLIERGEAHAAARDPGSSTMIRTLGLLGKAALWTVMALLALHNAGVNITALVAGMGIGGIAVALALQNILADVFSSVAIILDKPYQ